MASQVSIELTGTCCIAGDYSWISFWLKPSSWMVAAWIEVVYREKSATLSWSPEFWRATLNKEDTVLQSSNNKGCRLRQRWNGTVLWNLMECTVRPCAVRYQLYRLYDSHFASAALYTIWTFVHLKDHNSCYFSQSGARKCIRLSRAHWIYSKRYHLYWSMPHFRRFIELLMTSCILSKRVSRTTFTLIFEKALKSILEDPWSCIQSSGLQSGLQVAK